MEKLKAHFSYLKQYHHSIFLLNKVKQQKGETKDMTIIPMESITMSHHREDKKHHTKCNGDTQKS